jgi:opacity protein-like surface antigen
VQAVRGIRFLPGVQLGGVLPSSELGDVYGTGVRAGATLTAVAPTQPYGLRAALLYDRLAGGTYTPPGGAPVDVDGASMLSLTINGLYSQRAERNALLYFIAGVGVHRLEAESVESLDPGDDEPTDDPEDPGAASDTETKFGASVGGGLTFRIGGLPSYLEVNVVKLLGADAVLVPVVVGIQLGR